MRLTKVLSTVLLMTTLGATTTVLLPVTPANAQAKIKRFPKSWRGTWYAKPLYTYQMKHIRKNMAEPRMKLVIRAKTIKWNWYGYLPHNYDNRAYVMRIKPGKGVVPGLKGHGPHYGRTFLAKTSKHHMIFFYEHGNQTDLYR